MLTSISIANTTRCIVKSDNPFLSNCQVWTHLQLRKRTCEFIIFVRCSAFIKTGIQVFLDSWTRAAKTSVRSIVALSRVTSGPLRVEFASRPVFLWKYFHIPKACKSSELGTPVCPLAWKWVDLCQSLLVPRLAGDPSKMSWCTPLNAYWERLPA